MGVWYTDNSKRNTQLRLEGLRTDSTSNSMAELGATLLVIESDSLTSLRAILMPLVQIQGPKMDRGAEQRSAQRDPNKVGNKGLGLFKLTAASSTGLHN